MIALVPAAPAAPAAPTAPTSPTAPAPRLRATGRSSVVRLDPVRGRR